MCACTSSPVYGRRYKLVQLHQVPVIKGCVWVSNHFVSMNLKCDMCVRTCVCVCVCVHHLLCMGGGTSRCSFTKCLLSIPLDSAYVFVCVCARACTHQRLNLGGGVSGCSFAKCH